MRYDVATAARAEDVSFKFSFDDVQPEFRVVGRDGARRGIRLERFFWASLRRLADSRKSTLGQVIEEISRVQPEAGNLTSVIRVACMRSLADQNTELRRLASLKTVNAILLACPSPAFALSSSIKIQAFNPAFQVLLRRQLPVGQGESARPVLKLELDINIADLFARLDSNGENPVVTGFVIGDGDRRYRAQLNVVRAPVEEPELLLAFVFGG